MDANWRFDFCNGEKTSYGLLPCSTLEMKKDKCGSIKCKNATRGKVLELTYKIVEGNGETSIIFGGNCPDDIFVSLYSNNLSIQIDNLCFPFLLMVDGKQEKMVFYYEKYLPKQ